MTPTPSHDPVMRRSRYRAGDQVRVRSAAEIAATLDESGALEGMPFMPEMTRFCGSTFRVRASAHKTCDSITLGALRGMNAAAHLEGLHCDGAAHAGCQSRCPLFFKDAWLEPADAPAAPASDPSELERLADRSVRLHGRDPAAGTYSCQGTEILQATTPLPFFALRQYWDDVRSGNVSLWSVLRGLPVISFNKFQFISRRLLPRRLQFRGGRLHPNIVGTLERSPDLRLGLEAGEPVRIRSHDEILSTLDTRGCNRGLAFDVDMVPFCDRRAVVHHRVQTRIDERTGEVRTMKNPCLVLDGVVCKGRYHRFCPRAVDQYWREIWLEPLERPVDGGGS